MFRLFTDSSITKYNGTLNGATPVSHKDNVDLWRVFSLSAVKPGTVFTKGVYHFAPTLSSGITADYRFTVTHDFIFFGYIDPQNQNHIPALLHLLKLIGEQEAYLAGCYFQTTVATNPSCALYILTNNLTVSYRHNMVPYYHVIAGNFLARGEFGKVFFVEGAIKPAFRIFGNATYFPAQRKRLVKDQRFREAESKQIRRTQNEITGATAAEYLKVRDAKLLGSNMLPCSKNPEYYTAHRAEANFIFTMNYLNGDTLDKVYVKKQARRSAQHFLYSLPGRISIAISLLNTLLKLHQQDIIYCDLNLENILIVYDAMTGAPDVRIVDFGLSLQQDKRQHDGCCGTPLFLAPEVLKGCRYSTGSDIYGAALIIGSYILGNSQKLDGIKNFRKLMTIRARAGSAEFNLLTNWHPEVKEKLLAVLAAMTEHDVHQRMPLLNAISALEVIRRVHFVKQDDDFTLQTHLSQNHLLALQYRASAKPNTVTDLEDGLRAVIHRVHADANALQLFITTLGIVPLLYCDSREMLLEVVSFHVSCYRLAEQSFRGKLAELYQLSGRVKDEVRLREYTAYSETFLQGLQRQNWSIDTLISQTDHILSRVEKLDYILRRA